MTELNKKVLIVEDEEDVARAYEIKFKKAGLDASLSTDGEDALEKIMSIKPDVVLLDLMLPKRDGFWVLEEVKKRPELKKIKIIVLSNLGQEKDKERAFGLGAADYFVKTNISIKEIVDKVFGFLGIVPVSIGSVPPQQ